MSRSYESARDDANRSELGSKIGAMAERFSSRFGSSLDEDPNPDIEAFNQALERVIALSDMYDSDEDLTESAANAFYAVLDKINRSVENGMTTEDRKYINDVYTALKETVDRRKEKDGDNKADGWSFVGGKEKSYYERSFANSDTARFLNGETIKLINPVIKLKNGGFTNEISLEKFRNNEYTAEARYLLRAMVGDLIKSGSKDEKLTAIQWAKKLRTTGVTYPGAGDGTLTADAGFMLAQDRKADIYSSGIDKPNGYTGMGFNNEKIKKYVVDKIKDGTKKIIFGSGAKTKWDKLGKSKDEDDLTGKTYDDLYEADKARLDAMAEFLRTIAAGKSDAAIEALPGKDMGHMVTTLKLFKQIVYIDRDENALRMLGIAGSVPRIESQIVALSNNYANNNYRGGITKGADEGYQFIHIIDEIAWKVTETKPVHYDEDEIRINTHKNKAIMDSFKKEKGQGRESISVDDVADEKYEEWKHNEETDELKEIKGYAFGGEKSTPEERRKATKEFMETLISAGIVEQVKGEDGRYKLVDRNQHKQNKQDQQED